MPSYQQHSLEGASPVDLVVALYDGMIRFLYAAAAATDRRDESGRRAAVKRALDIILHLQARLRMDIGGRPAAALSDFYASTFALILQASAEASRARFEHAIECIRTVRDAWKQVASEVNPDPGPVLSLAGNAPVEPAGGALAPNVHSGAFVSSQWTV